MTPHPSPKPDTGRSRPSRTRVAQRTRHGDGVRALVVCLLLLGLLCGGWIVLNESAGRSADVERTETSPAKSTGTIKLGREGDRCQQLSIDNKTGQTSYSGLLPCENALPADPRERAKEHLRERYSGGRLDSIRDSFRTR